MIEKTQPDVIIHCAADRDPDSCERNPLNAEKMNVGVLSDLLTYSDPETQIIFISSDYVFSGDSPPYHEDSPTDPVNVYGRTKVEGEHLLRNREHSIILRVPLLIGAGPTWEESGFIYKTVQCIRSGESCEVDDVGVRFPTWTRDVAEFIAFLIDQKESGIFHFRGLRGKTKYGWACELGQYVNLPTDHIRPSVDPASLAKRPRDTHLELKRVNELHYTRIHDFLDAVQHIVSSHGIERYDL